MTVIIISLMVLLLSSVQIQWVDAEDTSTISNSDSNDAKILHSLSSSSQLNYPYCALDSRFLESAKRVYSREEVVAANPLCGRNLVVAYSQMEPLVYLNKSGLVEGVLPGKSMIFFISVHVIDRFYSLRKIKCLLKVKNFSVLLSLVSSLSTSCFFCYLRFMIF